MRLNKSKAYKINFYMHRARENTVLSSVDSIMAEETLHLVPEMEID
jgi:hypothetical protein